MFFKLLAYAIGCLACILAMIFVRSLRLRQMILLAVSYALYLLWGSWFLGVLLFSSICNYFLGAFLRRRTTLGRLWLGIAFNLVLLGTFKYLPGLANSAPSLWALHSFRQLILPLGISFWTFQALSYLFDLYREEELNPSLLEFCLYMAFWPTVLSGPICRLPDMLPQFRRPTNFSGKDIGQGIQRILTGIFMMAISQVFAVGIAPGQGVDGGFASPANLLGGLDVWCLAIGYGLQLFLNFAGYSHLVIGAARLFNIRLQENFNRPYASTSPSMFWTRWHMSLSFWIRDYVFFPLATLRREVWWRNLALALSMVIFGLWHKATLLFLIWGCYHGILLVLNRWLQQLQRRLAWEAPPKLWTPLSWITTAALISLGWIFFHASSTSQAGQMLS